MYGLHMARTEGRKEKKNSLTQAMRSIWGFICFITVCCCCIPYLIDATKDVEHKCGHCGVMLAVWHRGSGNAEVLQHS